MKRSLIRHTVLALGLASVTVGSILGLMAVTAQEPTPEQALRQARVGGSVNVESDFVASVRSFEPGNRTYWHKHAGGLLLFVKEGRARVQTRGGPMRELGPGEIDYAPPGAEHWHGAAPGEGLIQLGVVPFGGGIEFLEPVTDAEYNGQSR